MRNEGLFNSLVNQGMPPERIGELLSTIQPQDLSPLLEDLKPNERWRIFECLSPNAAAEVAKLMHLSPLVATLRRVQPAFCAEVLSRLPSNRATDIILHMKDQDRARILDKLKSGVRKEVEGLMKYPPHSAGGIMNTEIVKVDQNQTVLSTRAAVAALTDKKLHGVFVTEQERLLGFTSMQKLATSESTTLIKDIMSTQIPTVPPLEDQETIAQKAGANNWDLVAVVSEDGKLIGGITLHEIMHVVQHEATEDLYFLAGTRVLHPLQTPFITKVKMRLPWLLITLFGELLVALIITTLFKATIERAIIVSAFIPAVIAVGGNVGLQTTTVVVRGISTGVLKTRHVLKIVLNELQTGMLLGLICGVSAGVFALAINSMNFDVITLSISICLGMTAGCLATSMVGATQPMILYKFGLDPAIACGPAITLFNDLFGSIVYLTIAMLLNVKA